MTHDALRHSHNGWRGWTCFCLLWAGHGATTRSRRWRRDSRTGQVRVHQLWHGPPGPAATPSADGEGKSK
jgi:hypothetical protein